MRIPWRSNEKRFPLVRKGDKMLVLGGVSHMVVELAKARGAEVVTTASGAKHSISCD
jgi:NADPH:quinone reductase-like Zn-dependent oxidoreductase